MKNLIWFRQDLRLEDNQALTKAIDNATDGVIAVFIVTPGTWKQHDWSGAKVGLVLHQLQTIKADLQSLNIPLKIITVDNYAAIPKALQNLCEALSINAVFANQQPLLDERQRDQAVEKGLQSIDVKFHLCDDLTFLLSDQVLKGDGTPYKVFTPYKKAWLESALAQGLSINSKPRKQKPLSIESDEVPLQLKGFSSELDLALWPVGEKQIMVRLEQFLANDVSGYQEHRDFPSLEATSGLSPYFAIGAISVRQCIHKLQGLTGANSIAEVNQFPGPSIWLSELIWREFYYSIAVLFPQVVKGEPFKPETDFLPWSNNDEHFKAWCAGKTGFPLVDAGMRQLNQTGWMHNRLRMVVAMFLTKTLFINWRQGEQYFMQHLVDGDFPPNNGGWQWSASTGTDAVPYFRIFNPTTQSQRFDPKGEFIRQYCPELAGLSDKAIHQPNSFECLECDYPMPIVDYSAMRKEVIGAFKCLKELK